MSQNPETSAKFAASAGLWMGLAILALMGTAFGAERVLTPDHPGYVEKITHEQLAVIGAEGPKEKAELCLRFCRERRKEMGVLLEKREERQLGLLADAWLILVFDGAMKTARQGSDNRHNMVKTFAMISEELEVSQAVFRAMAQKGLSKEAGKAVERVRIQAELGIREARSLGEQERVRVRRHNAMLAEGRTRVREALQKSGMAEAAAEALTQQLMAGCEQHGSIHAELMASIAAGATNKSQTGRTQLAIAANYAVDSGCTDQMVTRLATQASLMNSDGLALQTRLLNEAGQLMRRCERNRDTTARSLGKLLRLCEELRIRGGEMTGILRQVQRMVRVGMTVDGAVGVAAEEIKTHGALPEEVEARQESALKLLRKMRSQVRRKVQQLRKEKAQFAKKSGQSKGGGK